MGSTAAARRAGRYEARPATARRTTAATAKLVRSCALMPNSQQPRVRQRRDGPERQPARGQRQAVIDHQPEDVERPSARERRSRILWSVSLRAGVLGGISTPSATVVVCAAENDREPILDVVVGGHGVTEKHESRVKACNQGVVGQN